MLPWRVKLKLYLCAGYESEVEEDAADIPAKEIFQEQRAERKKPEPYDVPTSGAFWMHDDRMDDEEFAASMYVLACSCKKPCFPRNKVYYVWLKLAADRSQSLAVVCHDIKQICLVDDEMLL